MFNRNQTLSVRDSIKDKNKPPCKNDQEAPPPQELSEGPWERSVDAVRRRVRISAEAWRTFSSSVHSVSTRVSWVTKATSSAFM